MRLTLAMKYLFFNPFSTTKSTFLPKNFFQGFLKMEVVCHVVPLPLEGGVEVYKQVHIALVVESIGEDRAKDSQSLDLVLEAKVDDSLHVQFNSISFIARHV